ncbi:MAG: hypothetical protein Q4D26_11530 [Clostridia bacterium]|nr:hypothetical protein [Clostridia bacterium]
MKQTTNHKLNKPDYTDVADIADINANMDIIDDNLGRVTVPTHTDEKGNRYADINGMHIRTDNSIYTGGGIKVVSVDPCADGKNLTEDMVTGNTSGLYVLAKIDENGNAVFKYVDAGSIDAVNITADKVVIDGISLQKLALHFSKAKGALYTDNSSNNTSDGSRKFIVGVYGDTPTTDSNNMPATLPDAGIMTRVESDGNGNGTYLEIYGDNVVCRNTDAVFKVKSIKTDTIRADNDLKIGGNSVAEMIKAKADVNHTHKLKTHIVVATYDTKNPLKGNADYTCTSTNASSVLKTAINAVAQGGRIELLDGTYNFQYSETEIELSKDITIEGSGYRTTIHQPVDEGTGEAKAVFKITGQNVKIKNIMLCDAVVISSVPMIEQQSQGAIYDNIFFIFNASEPEGGGCCIYGTGDCNFTKIQNCRVYKGFNDSSKIMFDFSKCTSFGGVIGGNISSGYNAVSVAFANEGQKNNTAIYGHSNIDIKIGG